MATKEEIRPIYSELQGYLSQAPDERKSGDATSDPSIWNQYNKAMDELSRVSGKTYNRFKIDPQVTAHGSVFVGISAYRGKLGGLISRLHAEFFSDEPPPFSGMPSTVITQTQQQSQSFQVQMVVEIVSKIDEKLPTLKKDSKERSFVEKVKASLASIRSVTQLIGLLLRTAQEFGLTTDQLWELFK